MAPATLTHSILVVDDDPDIALGLQDLLDHDGYQVNVAMTCAEALAQARAHHYNAVLLDLGLPDGDGTSVLLTLQQQQPQLPIIILTAYTSTDRTVGALTQGAFAYLTKPYNRDELRAVLQRAVGVQALAAKAEHAEHALHESEARFRSLVEAATDSIVLADAQGRIISWNPAASHLFGYTDDEVRGKPLSLLMPPRYRAAHERGLTRVGETGQSRLIGRLVELEGLRKDGTEFPLELSLAMWKTDDAIFYSGIIRDITQRRLAEDILDRLRHLHEVILTQAGEGIYGLDEKGRTTFVNPTAAQLLGYEPSELIEQPMHAVLHHSHPDGMAYPLGDCPIYAALRDGLVHRVSTDVFWRKDGGHIPVEYVCTPIVEKGHVAGAVVVFRDISERKQAERAVEESQERFRQLAEHIREVFWITNPEKTHVLYISPGYEAIWGRTCDSLYAHPASWLDAIHPEDRPRIQDAAMNRQTLEVYDEEYRILRPDGSLRWIWDRAYPIRDASGMVYRIVGFAEDITESKRVEADLIDSERRYRALFEDNPSMYFMVNADGLVLSVNRFGAERLGYDQQELIGTSVVAVFHPADQDTVRRNLASCLSDVGQPKSWELRNIRKDGSMIWVRETAQAVRNDRQVPVVLIVCEDISAMKEAEIALHDSEEMKNQILHSSADCIKVLDLDGRLQYMNEAGQRLLDIKDLVAYTGKSWAEFWEGDDRDAAMAALEAARSGDIGKFVGFCPTTGGQPKWWDVQVTPMLDTQGFSRRLLAISRDMTAYKHVQESLRASEERLEHVIRGSHDGFWDGHVLPGYPWHSPITPVWWSPRVREMLGYSEEEFPDILDSWASRLHPDDREGVFRRLQACMEEGASHYDVEYRLLNKHQAYQWFHARAEVVQRDAQGRAVRMAGALQDITDRKQTEANLILSEERLRMALAASDLGIWDWDVPSNRLYWSDGVEALFGLAPGSFPGTYPAYIGLIYLLDRGSTLTRIELSLRDHTSITVRHRVVWPDGTIHWLEWTGRIYRGTDGVATRVLGIIHDTKGHTGEST
ncbi:MAG: PAS domain S-box protein [Nitrospira sp.]|nr:PAS domain S-box protein [Nitrospira sp.]